MEASFTAASISTEKSATFGARPTSQPSPAPSFGPALRKAEPGTETYVSSAARAGDAYTPGIQAWRRDCPPTARTTRKPLLLFLLLRLFLLRLAPRSLPDGLFHEPTAPSLPLSSSVSRGRICSNVRRKSLSARGRNFSFDVHFPNIFKF